MSNGFLLGARNRSISSQEALRLTTATRSERLRRIQEAIDRKMLHDRAKKDRATRKRKKRQAATTAIGVGIGGAVLGGVAGAALGGAAGGATAGTLAGTTAGGVIGTPAGGAVGAALGGTAAAGGFSATGALIGGGLGLQVGGLLGDSPAAVSVGGHLTDLGQSLRKTRMNKLRREQGVFSTDDLFGYSEEITATDKAATSQAPGEPVSTGAPQASPKIGLPGPMSPIRNVNQLAWQRAQRGLV